GGLSLPLEPDGNKIPRGDQNRDRGSLAPTAGFHKQPGEHVEIAIHHTVGDLINSPPANMPRLQLWRIRGRRLVRQRLVLCGDDVYSVLRIAITPKLKVSVFEISQVMEIPIST